MSLLHYFFYRLRCFILKRSLLFIKIKVESQPTFYFDYFYFFIIIVKPLLAVEKSTL